MLFKKIAVAAAVASTLAFVGCNDKKAPDAGTAASTAASEVVASSQALDQAPASVVASTPVVDTPASVVASTPTADASAPASH